MRPAWVLGSALLWALFLTVPDALAAGAPALDSPERPVIPALARPAGELRACSFREPVCVHTVGKVDPGGVMPALAALERAVRGLRALDLEPPRDGGAGGSQAFDLYLTTDPALGGAAWSEPRLYARGFDRANAFGIATLERGCRLDSEMARIVAQAALLRLDGGLEDGTLAMQSSYIARLIAPCAPIETAAIDRFQREPERALSEGKRQRFEGSMLFSAYLDEVHGKGQPGGVVNGLVAIAAQSTPAKATHWQNEPDLFD
ncbi:MAG TPA: hypothetical protein VFB62_25065, partial [Polyangiaceae bacterium]|nr:hypothetical protein [Polyangiaceae bacterium]